ncbi:sigma 54-interacting transcriptional regulator [Tissierella sp. MSJ-40]|uniref:Sigma 54-interacting transcriptional regulator n=1 Tax=Tissierella simiarum TaxID=2841534 RepID=A0ABS6E5N2_9FIRM|nr:sigma 54-interacting transcriptional regulator [Tissierella simiarum]MBU5438087.1 sigma 54-interacting transcriptional regulator [Tissierella simiarum]
MEQLFSLLQDELNHFVQVISQVLKVDVQIIDSQYKRVAGTGYWQDKIDESIRDHAYITKRVFETGKNAIIHNPKENLICNNCNKKDNCMETMEISIPIKFGERIIGTIECVCTNKEQKEYIVNNENTYIVFIEQMAKLLESRVIEEIEKRKKLKVLDLLDNVLNKINEGVVIIDSDCNIVNFNNYAKNILKIDTNLNRNINIESTGNMVLKLQEYKIKYNGNTFTVVGERYDVNYGNQEINEVIVFTSRETLKEQFLELSGSKHDIGLDKIIGNSKVVKELKRKISTVASSESTILITGESGTGKELVARALHNESNRADKPFVAVNCAAIPDSLLESELFGYSKGAFTGANPKGKIGKIELADEGTLFLDEIGDMPLYMQAKVLRVLEDKSIVKLGDLEEKLLNIRIVAATNKNLEEMIKENTFREDLYYRLNVIPINIRPLRERKEDIKILFSHFLKKYGNIFNKEVRAIDKDIWTYLYAYDWSGNIRELENTAEYSVNMLKNDEIISIEHLPSKILASRKPNIEIKITLDDVERQLIEEYLNTYGSSLEGKKKAAEKLGISIATLYRKIKKYNI